MDEDKSKTGLTGEDLSQISGGAVDYVKQESEQQVKELLNRRLNDFPKGKTIGVDKSIGRYKVDQDLPDFLADHQKKK